MLERGVLFFACFAVWGAFACSGRTSGGASGAGAAGTAPTMIAAGGAGATGVALGGSDFGGVSSGAVAGSAAAGFESIAGAESDAGPEKGITVVGTVIDTWRQPAVGWSVALGGVSTSTNDQGQFTFTHVMPPYDVAFKVPGVPNTSAVPELWVYRGLTRPDPTLQPDFTLGAHLANLYLDRTNIPMPVSADGGAIAVGLAASFGAPDTAFGASVTPFGGYAVETRWSGQASITGTVHALAWAAPSGLTGGGLDNQYLAFQAQALTLVPDVPGTASPHVTLDFSMSSVPTATFPVTIPSSTSARPSVGGWLVFDSGDAIGPVSISEAPAALSVPLPVLPKAHAAFSASLGYQPSKDAGFTEVYREALSPDSATTLVLPEPRELVAPDDGASGVDANTTFQWSAAPAVSVLSVDCSVSSIRLHVVALASSGQLPSAPGFGMAPPKGATCSWRIDVHGAFPTIDDASGPSGMIDGCQYAGQGGQASLRGNGSLAVSKLRTFSTAP